MSLKPIFTEKSLKMAQSGVYSFWVLPKFTKGQIKSLISKTFNVKVGSVKTLNYKSASRKNFRGRIVTSPALKKALVMLRGKDKIDIFETEKKK